MVAFCQHTKDRPGCPAHPATPPFLQPHPCLLHFHCFCRVFGNLHSGFPSICTNKLKSAAPALSVSPGCLQAHEVQDGNGGPQAGACGAHLGKGMGGALLRLGMIFSPELSWLCFVALCSCPVARAVGVGDLEALSRKAFKWVPAGLWCGCFGPGRVRARAAVRKILLESCLMGRATRVSRPGGSQRLCRPRSQRPSHRVTVRRNQPG